MAVTARMTIDNQWDGMTLAEIERRVIERTLERTGGNKTRAAAILGIYRPRLYGKIKKYGIQTEASDYKD